MYARMSVHTCTKNGFRLISFEKINVLDSYFMNIGT